MNNTIVREHQIVVKINLEMYKKLKFLAKKEDRSVSSFLRVLIANKLQDSTNEKGN